MLNEVAGEFREVYSGYPLKAILIGGWGIFFLVIIVSIILGRFYNKRKV